MIELDLETEYGVLDNYLREIHRTISHIAYYDLPRMRTTVASLEDNRDLRVSYILGEICKKTLADKIYKNDIKRKRERELLHIYELLNLVVTENFNTIYNDALQQLQPVYRNIINQETLQFMNSLNEKIITLDNLRDYCNKRLAKISVTYNTSVISINDTWQFTRRKYNVSELAKD